MTLSAHDDQTRVVVLLSGGVDSTACVHFYRSRGFQVEALFVDYGQPASEEERRAARKVAKHFDAPLREAGVAGLGGVPSGYIVGRNAMLFTTALAAVAPSEGLIALGVHAGTAYCDCGPEFIAASQRVADVYTGGRVQVAAPFLDWHKGDIYRFVLDSRLPLELTYSCELGRSPPCGLCPSCLDRARCA